MTLSAPSTFAPSLPSLPSYPRPLAASRSASPAPASKRRPLNRTFQPSCPAAQFTFSTAPFGDTANDRLKMMIREGKEALGAKVEVVYDDEDDDMF